MGGHENNFLYRDCAANVFTRVGFIMPNLYIAFHSEL